MYYILTHISLSKYLLIGLAAQVSIFYDVVILLDIHPSIISSVPFTTDISCFSSQSIPFSGAILLYV